MLRKASIFVQGAENISMLFRKIRFCGSGISSGLKHLINGLTSLYREILSKKEEKKKQSWRMHWKWKKFKLPDLNIEYAVFDARGGFLCANRLIKGAANSKFQGPILSYLNDKSYNYNGIECPLYNPTDFDSVFPEQQKVCKQKGISFTISNA